MEHTPENMSCDGVWQQFFMFEGGAADHGDKNIVSGMFSNVYAWTPPRLLFQNNRSPSTHPPPNH